MFLLNNPCSGPQKSLLETYFPETISSFQQKTGLELKDLLLLQESDAFYQALIAGYSKIALQTKELFLLTDLAQFDKRPQFDFAQFLRAAYQGLLFFPEEDVLVRFEEIGIKRRLLRRFVSLEKIVEQIDLITADGTVWMPKARVLLYIKDYLDKQVAVDIFHLLDLTAELNGRTTTTLELAISNAYRRRKYSGGAPLQYNMGEPRLIDWFIDAMEDFIGGKEETRKRLLKTASGNTDKILFQSIKGMSRFEPTAENKRRFVPLFELLSTRYAFLSQTDHQDADRFYDQFYPTYLKRRFDQVTK